MSLLRPDIDRTLVAMGVDYSTAMPTGFSMPHSRHEIVTLHFEGKLKRNYTVEQIEVLIVRAVDIMRTLKIIELQFDEINPWNFAEQFVIYYAFVNARNFAVVSNIRKKPGSSHSAGPDYDFVNSDFFSKSFKNSGFKGFDKTYDSDEDIEERKRKAKAKQRAADEAKAKADKEAQEAARKAQEIFDKIFGSSGFFNAFGNDPFGNWDTSGSKNTKSKRTGGTAPKPPISDNPYIVLGVLTTASSSEIKTARRNKIKEWHPDLSSNSHRIKEATEMCQRINAAYVILEKAGKVS